MRLRSGGTSNARQHVVDAVGDPEQPAAEAGVDGSEEEEHARHCGVGVPELHRPGVGVARGRRRSCRARCSGRGIEPDRRRRGRRRVAPTASSSSLRGNCGSSVNSQNRANAAGSSSTRKSVPCANPADGPRRAMSSRWSMTAGSTGRCSNTCTIRRRRTTSANSTPTDPTARTEREFRRRPYPPGARGAMSVVTAVRFRVGGQEGDRRGRGCSAGRCILTDQTLKNVLDASGTAMLVPLVVSVNTILV